MKKNLLISLLSAACIGTVFSCVFAAEYLNFSRKFIKNFKECDTYQESVSSQFEGKSFNINRKIVGWRNGACKYEESYESQGEKYKLSCNFSNIQVDDLYDAMRGKQKEVLTKNVEIFKEEQNPKTGEKRYVVSGTTAVKGNKSYVTWTRYLNNPYFCKVEK